MAITAKRIVPQGSGNFVTTDANVAATDLQYTFPDGEIFQHELSRIETVIVYTGTATIDGKTFNTGTWDLSKVGGLPITGAPVQTLSVSGSCLVTAR
jgi:hypothetical protein